MKIEIRSDSVIVSGYVNAVERESRLIPSPKGRFREKVAARTFEKALLNQENVELRFNHNPNRRLGSLKDGNLELHEDVIGLHATATVTDKEVIEKARKGEIRGWSFGFIDKKSTWEDQTDGIQLRTLEELELIEVSILDKTPAYIATSIEARGEEDVLTESRHLEDKVSIEDFTENRSEVDYSAYEKQIELLKTKGGN